MCWKLWKKQLSNCGHKISVASRLICTPDAGSGEQIQCFRADWDLWYCCNYGDERTAAATRVWDQVRSCGICGGQSGTGAGFLGEIFAANHSTDYSIPIIIRDWCNRPKIGLRTKSTQSHPSPPHQET
jgi:hypothetical protein